MRLVFVQVDEKQDCGGRSEVCRLLQMSPLELANSMDGDTLHWPNPFYCELLPPHAA